MRIRLQSWTLIAVSLILGVLLSGCGGGGEVTSVPIVDRPQADTTTGRDTSQVRSPAALVPIPAGYDTVQSRRFDRGRLWTLGNLPVDYFRREYGFVPDDEWVTKVQRSALKFGDNCSASFVSADGLVLTNHHCARKYISEVSKSGEALLENGFYAPTLTEERPTTDLYVEQLVNIEEVTDKVYGNLRRGRRAGAQARERQVESLQEKMTAAATKRDSSLRVRIQPVYQGTKYAAYTFRRHRDVRLVMAPELQLGFFGGSSDNFTYPRHALDVAFFRVYAPDGTPLQPEYHFSWDRDGATAGEALFAVGHPASTSRSDIPSQLEYERDHLLPNRLDVLRNRRQLLDDYIRNHPDSTDRYDLQNPHFTIQNTIKALEGQLRGLHDPYLLARRAKAVRALHDSIMAVDSLRKRYGSVIEQLQQLQQSKTVMADKEGAFVTFSNLQLGSRILVRALHGYYYDFLRKRTASRSRVQSIRRDAETVRDWPAGLEKPVLTAQLREIRETYGSSHPTIQRLFSDISPPQLARRLVKESALTDSSAFIQLLDEGYRNSADPSVRVIEALAPMFLNVSRQMQDIRNSEESLNARLSRVRFSIYGSTFPPDANGSLRLSDGRVRSYRYNGTVAPPFTNFHGLYDRYYSHHTGDWSLPSRWVNLEDSLDLGTPLNLVSTNDIAGGSSGSALLDEELNLVGVVFDSNIEGLPNKYLYRDRAARAVSVDVRGIRTALRVVYNAGRLLQEIRSGEYPSSGASNSTGEGEGGI